MGCIEQWSFLKETGEGGRDEGFLLFVSENGRREERNSSGRKRRTPECRQNASGKSQPSTVPDKP